MTLRYNFKLIERDYKINLSGLPRPNKEYGDKAVYLYGIDAVRFSGFEELETPKGGLKFLNKIWNLPIKEFSLTEDNINGISYYMAKHKYHNVIAIIRKIINKEKAISPLMIDVLSPFIPFITAKMKENENYI